jgi:myosin-5
MEIFFNQDLKLCAAFTTNYLLEKIRVPHPALEERNYHIFYQLCSAPSDVVRKK